MPSLALKRSLQEQAFEVTTEEWEATLAAVDPDGKGCVAWRDLNRAFLEAKEAGWATKESVEAFFRKLEKHLRSKQQSLPGMFREMDGARRGVTPLNAETRINAI